MIKVFHLFLGETMIYNTTLKEKKENFKEFCKLVENQFTHGSDKYKATSQMEVTDMICQTFPGESGVDWVLGTIMKYLKRYQNYGREKDLLKIATYSYIIWLKKGHYIQDKHDEDIFK